MPRKNYPKVLINDTFILTWVSSGITPTTISLKIYDGSNPEQEVSSPVTVQSATGHYYANGLVSSKGWYVAEWFAEINGNDYRRRTKFRAQLEDVD